MKKTYKKSKKRNNNTQYEFRRAKFPFYQYWVFYYTECYKDKTEKDFATFIKAKSYELAKNILVSKVQEDLPGTKIKAMQGYMLHKDYKNGRSNRHFSIKDWGNVKASSFPNLSNFLFKKETERPEGFDNRFNKTDKEHLKTIGFKKGSQNWSKIHRKGVFLAIDERKGKKWNGDRWVEWDSEERKKTKSKILNSLIVNDGNRTKSAEYLNISRGNLYKLMLRCEDKSWWDKHYPTAKPIPPRVPKEQRSATQRKVMLERMKQGEVPFSKLSKEQKEMCEKNRTKALKKKSESKFNELIPKMKEALSLNRNSRKKAAEYMGIKICTFRKYIIKTKNKVNWAKEFPIN